MVPLKGINGYNESELLHDSVKSGVKLCTHLALVAAYHLAPRLQQYSHPDLSTFCVTLRAIWGLHRLHEGYIGIT